MVLEGDQNGVINFRASGILFWPIRLLDAVLSYPDGGRRLGVRNSPIDIVLL